MALMQILSQVLAGIVLAGCVVLLVRMVIGAPRRARLDAAVLRLVDRLRRRPPAPRPTGGADAREAARVAEEAIRRAARRGRWEGNVYKPDAFRPPDENRPDRRRPH